MIRYSILTASDQGAAGLREDQSSQAISAIMTQAGGQLIDYLMVPDDRPALVAALIKLTQNGSNLVLTTGGTGFAPRDVTPEATLEVIERQVPGIPEAMRLKSFAITPQAMLSRAVAGIRGNCLIINLPGSPKAVEECLTVILPVLGHATDLLRGTGGDCAR